MKIIYFIRDISDCGGIQQTTCYGINSIIRNSKDYEIATISLYHKNKQNFFSLDSCVKNHALFKEKIDTKKQYFKIKKRLDILIKQINPDIIVVQGTAFASYLSVDVWRRCKVIVCEHGHYDMGGKFGLHWFGKKISLKYAKAIVTLTKLDAQNYIKNNKNKIIIKNIYNPCFLQKDGSVQYNLESKVIVSCGTIDNIKRFDHVVKAAEIVFAKHPDWCWYFYGDGPQKKNLEQLIEDKHLESNVFLKGYETDKSIIFGDKSFMVLTSRFEGFGMVLIEAMQYRLPVISYDIKYGPKEIVINNHNGLLVESGNIELLAKAVDELIENADKRKNMSIKANTSLNKFDSEVITKQWLDLFKVIKQEV